MKTRDRRKLMKERSRVKTPEELLAMEKLLAELRKKREEAVNLVAPIQA